MIGGIPVSTSAMQAPPPAHPPAEPAAARATLARWMLGHWNTDTDGQLAEAALDTLMAQAWDEGVTVLVCRLLAEVPTLSGVRRAACHDWLREQAAAELGRRMRLRAVLVQLQQAGIEALVLKGAALAQWLYPAPYLRESSDVDLLLANREQALAAVAALASLGYAMPFTPTRFRHELSCGSADGRLDLDLHWALSDWPALERLPDYPALAADAVALPGLAPGARGLDAAHALLHACVHRASNLAANLGDRLKWLYDLHLLAQALDRDDGWPRLLALSRQAQVCGIVTEGLAASAALFGTTVPEEVHRALAVARVGEPLDASRLQDWGYIQRRNFKALPGWGARLAWLGERLLPPADHLRALYGQEHSWPQLLWLRLRRGVTRVGGTD